MLLETTIMWTPWAIGMADAGLTAYYANNFQTGDIDTSRGELGGSMGHALLGLGSASLAVQSWAVFEWIKYVLKREEGKVTIQNRNLRYGKAMMWFWWMMLLFYLVAIVSSALDVHLVTNFGSVSATPPTTTGGKLTGSYGNGVEGMSYATLAVGGISFFTYLYAEFFTRRMDESHPTIIEAHGGS